MYYIFTRMEFVLAFVFAAIVTALLVFVPPYEKMVYEKSPAITQEDVKDGKVRITGYRAGEGIPVAKSEEDMRGEDGLIFFTLHINESQLEPTGLYRELNNGKYETNKLKVFVLDHWKTYGQFYIVTLDSGEKMPVFMREGYLNKDQGWIDFPVCKKWRGNGLSDYWGSKVNTYQKYDLNYSDTSGCNYIDACTFFPQGSEMESFKTKQTFAAIIIFIICLFGGSMLLFMISSGIKKK